MRRFVFAPRWVAGHVTVIVVVVACLLLGRWQWGVSQHTHSLQNMAYALQWPMFAVFFAVMWWRMLRLECRKLDGEFDDELDEEVRSSDAAEPSGTGEPAGARVATSVTKPVAQGVSAQGVSAQGVSARREPVREQAQESEEDAQLAAYNRMLAELAARDNAR
ncbi:MAG TPA: hypothetical protein VFE65_05825 [Pseudonocardia sp.]|jgi:hypothetical protein|nr:hypothetical protein [Pseudonocardia sp.]